MQKMHMLTALPNHSLDGGRQLLESLSWNIKIVQHENTWTVMGGEKAILTTTVVEAAESFLYGLALAYSLMPPDLFEELRERTRP